MQGSEAVTNLYDCHHWSPQLDSSQSSLLFGCFLRSLAAPEVLEDGALLAVVDAAVLALLVVVEPGAVDLLCDDNRVPAGFSIDDFDDVCQQQRKWIFLPSSTAM